MKQISSVHFKGWDSQVENRDWYKKKMEMWIVCWKNSLITKLFLEWDGKFWLHWLHQSRNVQMRDFFGNSDPKSPQTLYHQRTLISGEEAGVRIVERGLSIMQKLNLGIHFVSSVR